MEKIFFDSWTSIIRILIISISSYAILIFLLRISGKRTLSKMNAFDFVITIALGSTLSSVILTKEISLFDGILALGLLIYLQYLATWISVRSGKFGNLIKSAPVLLFYDGQFLIGAMHEERILKSEILATVRRNGVGSLKNVDAVVLETDGSLSVIKKIEDMDDSVLSDVKRVGEKK